MDNLIDIISVLILNAEEKKEVESGCIYIITPEGAVVMKDGKVVWQSKN